MDSATAYAKLYSSYYLQVIRFPSYLSYKQKKTILALASWIQQDRIDGRGSILEPRGNPDVRDLGASPLQGEPGGGRRAARYHEPGIVRGSTYSIPLEPNHNPPLSSRG